MNFLPPLFEAKKCPPQQLSHCLTKLKRPLVFTNGCFDILHRGHVTYLAQAKVLGTSLIVALNSDASVKRLGKGNDRPINKLEDRSAVIAALEAVDCVTWFEEDTPLNLILACKPDILVKGGDWRAEDMVGGKEVQAWGGKVVSIPFLHEQSTTKILEKIKEA